MIKFDLRSSALAIATSCLCPCEKFAPPDETSVFRFIFGFRPEADTWDRDGADEEARDEGFSAANVPSLLVEGTRLGRREGSGVSDPRLTRARASFNSSSVCSSKGSRFIRTVPEKRTASGISASRAPVT